MIDCIVGKGISTHRLSLTVLFHSHSGRTVGRRGAAVTLPHEAAYALRFARISCRLDTRRADKARPVSPCPAGNPLSSPFPRRDRI